MNGYAVVYIPPQCLAIYQVPGTHYQWVMWPLPFCGSKVFHPVTYSLTTDCRPPAVVTAKIKNKKRIPWLSRSRSERHVV